MNFTADFVCITIKNLTESTALKQWKIVQIEITTDSLKSMGIVLMLPIPHKLRDWKNTHIVRVKLEIKYKELCPKCHPTSDILKQGTKNQS